jgi:alpha-ketoglutarate-dependent taurine dioxygenase
LINEGLGASEIKRAQINATFTPDGCIFRGRESVCRTEASTVAEIKSALLEFSVIFFRHQPIDQDHQLRLAAQFGTIEEPQPVFD